MFQAIADLVTKPDVAVIPGRRSRTRNPVAPVVKIVSEGRGLFRSVTLPAGKINDQARRSGFRVPLRGPGMTTLIVSSLLTQAPAHAACPQELSIYEDTSGNSLTFIPPHDTQAAEHEFKLRIGATELQGIVMWSKEPDRPNGIVMDHCPDGDVTGEELNACTVWQGVIYGLTKDATAPFIGKRGTPHAEALLLPDLSRYAMEHTYKTPLAGPPKVDDVFRMKACQE